MSEFRGRGTSAATAEGVRLHLRRTQLQVYPNLQDSVKMEVNADLSSYHAELTELRYLRKLTVPSQENLHAEWIVTSPENLMVM